MAFTVMSRILPRQSAILSRCRAWSSIWTLGPHQPVQYF